MKQFNDFFRHRQYMEQPDYELYNYSDKPDLKIQPHMHDFYEIYLLLSDEVDIIAGNQIYHVKSRDILLFSPNTLHYPAKYYISKEQYYRRIVFWCQKDFFQQFANRDPSLNAMWAAAEEHGSLHIRPDSGESKLLYALFIRLMDEKQQPDSWTNTMIFSLLSELFVHLNRLLVHSKDVPKHAPVTELFNNILYYIHIHITEELSLEILAEQFYVTKGYISRIFREYMGTSVHQYILTLRLENASAAIRKGIPVVQAAEQAGFSDYTCFYRAFKKVFDLSPKEYAKKMKPDCKLPSHK